MDDFATLEASMQISTGTLVMYGIIFLIGIVSYWKIYTKMGEEGWKSIIPIYNLIVILEKLNRPIWHILLFLIPLVNIYMIFKVYIELSERFGKGTGFGIGLVLLSFIFAPILAFSDAQWQENNKPVSLDL